MLIFVLAPKQRTETQKQNQAAVIQGEIFNNILKNSLGNKEGNYGSLLSGLNYSSGKFGEKSGLRMGTGERKMGSKICIDLVTQAQDVRAKADRLMEALKRADEQKQLEAVWQKELIRKSLIKMTL